MLPKEESEISRWNIPQPFKSLKITVFRNFKSSPLAYVKTKEEVLNLIYKMKKLISVTQLRKKIISSMRIFQDLCKFLRTLLKERLFKI